MKLLNSLVPIVPILFSTFISVNSQLDFRKTLLTTENIIDAVFKQINVHHVILINRDKIRDTTKEIVSKSEEQFVTKYPTRILNFDDTIKQNLDKTNKVQPFLLNRTSILYVIALKSNALARENNDTFLQKLRALSNDTIDSKFFFFAYSKYASNYFEAFLKSAWRNDLIDVTICEFVESNSNELSKNSFLPIINVGNKDLSYIVKIHNYNPFTKSYNRKLYQPNDTIFPNKLNNLHHQRLRVGLVHYPPYSDITKNKNGNVLYKASHGKLIDTIKDKLNFEISPKVAKMAQYGTLLPNGSATGLIGDIGNGELDVVAFGAFNLFSPFSRLTDRTRHISIEQSCAVVPLILSPGILIGSSFKETVAVISILISVIWISKHVLNFKSKIWSPLNIGFLVLGIGVDGQPTKLRERFVYACIMIVSLFYSSNVFAQLTSVNLKETSYLKFESFNDLDESQLVPICHPNLFNITFGFGDKVLQSLSKKAIPRPDYSDVCPSLLLNNKNVTCILEDLQASLLIKKVGMDKMKVAKPCFWHATRSFILRKASPYTTRFDQIIRHIDESGLPNKWWIDYFFDYAKQAKQLLNNEQENLKDKLKDMSYEGLRVFVPFGLSVSSVVFIAEILIHRLKIKQNHVVELE